KDTQLRGASCGPVPRLLPPDEVDQTHQRDEPYEKIAVPSRRDVVIKDPLHDAHRRLVGRVDKHHIERGGDEKDRPDAQSLLRADHRPDHAHTSKTDSYRSAGTAVNKTSNTNSSRSHVPVAGVTSPVTAAVTIATPPKATGV